MEAFLFGESESPLFGAYHEPTGAAREVGVLLCPAIAQEYVRSHWALRQLAAALSRAGLHVLRFDWFGVGDSAGDARDATVARWIEDCAAAAAELRDRAGIRRVSVVGLRAGAAIAAAAMKRGLKVRDAVWWDPVLDGRTYLEQMIAMHQVVRRDPRRFGFSLRRDLAEHLPALLSRPDADGELCGVAFPEPLRAGLRELDVAALLGGVKVDRQSFFVGEEREDVRRVAAALGGRVEVVGTPARWQDSESLESAFLPGATLAAIVKELAR